MKRIRKISPSAVAAVITAAPLTICAPVAAAGGGGESPLRLLVDTAAQRLMVADPVAAAKWIHGGDIIDPLRVREVLESVGEDARQHGLDEGRITAIFIDQINATEAIEFARFAQWKLNPKAAPTNAEGMQSSRDQIDDDDRVMVAELDRNSELLGTARCTQMARNAVDEVAGRRALEALYRHALQTATSSYCMPVR